MRILLINSVYAVGSTGKIVEDINHYCLANGDEGKMLYGREGRNLSDETIKVSTEIEAKIHSLLSRCTGVDFGYSLIATTKAISIIKSFKPDVVHLHCLNGHFINVFRLVTFLKDHNIPTVLTLHAEIMHTAGCEHAFDCMKWTKECYDCSRIKGYVTHYFRDDARYAYRKMKKAFDGYKNLSIVSVSEWLTNRARQSGVFSDCKASFLTIENGLDLKAFHPISIEDNPLFKKYNKGGKPCVLHITPNFNHPLKGGRFALDLAKLHPDWTFIIVGYNGNGDVPKNVIAISHTKDKQELAQYYNYADLTLLTSKRETFSMVCAESLSCGTPVVGFMAGGPESVFKGDYAEFVEYDNVLELDEALQRMIDRHPNIDVKSIQLRFSANIMAEKYYSCYQSLVEKLKNN